MGHHHCIGKDCCRCARLSVVYFATLIIQAIVIVQTTAFLFLNYLRGTGIYSVIHSDLKYVLILLATVQVLWFISAAGTIYSMQRIIPHLMLPHLFTSLLLLFAAMLLITLTTYHIIKGLRPNCSLMLLLLLLNLYSFGALYSIYLTLSCYRLLMRKRKSVINVAENVIPKETLTSEVLSSVTNSISYSRRSTAIISDNYLHMVSSRLINFMN